MSVKKGISLPHPVLGLGDDIKGSLKIKIKATVQNQELLLAESEVIIDNEYFNELYQKKVIETAYKIRCSSTLFAMAHKGKLDLKISCDLLSDKVYIECYLIAAEDIKNYTHHTFNSDCMLGDNKGIFNIRKATIVGDAGLDIILLEDKFTGSLSGIIEFKAVEIDSPIKIDTEDQKIIVSYPSRPGETDMVTLLSQKNSKFKDTFMNLFLIPALTEGFRVLIEKKTTSEYEEYTEEHGWAGIIDSIYRDFDEDDDPYELAQLFLQRVIQYKNNIKSSIPAIRALSELTKYLDDDKDI